MADKMSGADNKVKPVAQPNHPYQKDLSKFRPVPTDSKEISCGYVVLNNPPKPKFHSRTGDNHSRYTQPSNHFTPAGAVHSPASGYLNGRDRRPGGSNGRGYLRK